MQKEITVFFTALVFFTRIPCYRLANYTAEYLNKASKYFSFIGWIVGGTAALVYIGTSYILPHSIAILLSIISTILITGAFHEDGFADSCDGFGGGSTKEQILNIMKDSTIGTYGVIGLISILSLKYLSLAELSVQNLPLIFIAGHSLSRFTATTFILTHSYARENDDKSKTQEISKKLNLPDFLIAAIFGILPVFLLGYVYLLAIIPVFIAREIIGYYLRRKIGGYTGDNLGATQQITEVIFYITVLIIQWKFI